ncbi:MAG: hypothetical protein F6J87_31585 [Spirulina sp. SIO3F2]|nr:hypothetical protein [Spirulina sp. SIO3F2]
MPDIRVGAGDLDRLLQLLSEYTAKLRKLCEERAERRNRLMQSTALMTTAMVVLVTFFYEFIGRDKATDSQVKIIMIAGMSVPMVFAFTRALPGTRLTYGYDAKQVYVTVERLIKTASQYSEHSSRRLSDKFEFDLRLAEAEAAMHMYRELFGTSPSKD